MNSVDIYKNESIVCSDGKEHILAGPCALMRNGLVSFISTVLDCWTLKTGISGLDNLIVRYYFNPWATKKFDTVPSKVCGNILVPTAERALVEYVLFHEYFDEGLLLEGLNNYLSKDGCNKNRLFEEMDKFIPERVDWLSYWINESKDWTGA